MFIGLVGVIMLRIGNGYDAHRLSASEKLILGGVLIPYEMGLCGHSDADVLVHAIIDAMLGALALGDIGKMFPDTDMAYKGASSIKLLEQVAIVCKKNGFIVSNVDSIIIAQKPKLSPYIAGMRDNIAKALNADCYCVSVKATTEEFMGFTGACEGIAAHAVCLMEKIVTGGGIN